jgi:hypothetical protein
MIRDLSWSSDRIIEAIKAGVSRKGIAQREGLNHRVASNIINDLIAKHGLTYVPKDDVHAYGTTNETALLRSALGGYLFDLRQQLGGDRAEVARLVGLNRRDQVRAEQRPFQHDWKVSEMERLAHATGITLKELLDGII